MNYSIDWDGPGEREHEAPKRDLVLNHWIGSKITVMSPTGYEETLTLEQLSYILHRIEETRDDK